MVDITGNKYERLTVLKYVGEGNGLWLCKCDCGNETLAKRNSLEMGRKKSCGCLFHEIKRKRRKYNKYVLSDDFCVGFDNDGKKFFFDIEDFDKIKKYYWHVGTTGYVNTSDNNIKFSMHKIIMNSDQKHCVDHINHIKHDNRRKNLRLCSLHQNTFNKRIARNNSSGHKGVCKEKNKWHAYIFYNNKTIHLGRYINKNDAIMARKKKELELFGEYSNYYFDVDVVRE